MFIQYCVGFFTLASFNRTIVELKLFICPLGSVKRFTFNRTIVELKQVVVLVIDVRCCAFNRTIVELKPKKPMEWENSTGSFYC